MTKTPKLQRSMGLHQRSINPTSRALKGQKGPRNSEGRPRTRAFNLTFGRSSVPCWHTRFLCFEKTTRDALVMRGGGWPG